VTRTDRIRFAAEIVGVTTYTVDLTQPTVVAFTIDAPTRFGADADAISCCTDLNSSLVDRPDQWSYAASYTTAQPSSSGFTCMIVVTVGRESA
jgi:hypothetical protein